MYMDDVKENIEKGTIDIIYAEKLLSTHTRSKALMTYFLIILLSQIHEPVKIRTDLITVPHLLVSGETSGGKSTFLRQFITTLYLNNPTYEFVLIDLKEGLEFQLFEDLARVKVITEVKNAVARLSGYEDVLKKRMHAVKQAGCVDFPGYVKKLGDSAEAR